MKLQEIISENKVIDLNTLTQDQELVKQIQIRLKDLRLLQPSDVDGIWGPTTQGAVTEFCEAVHLSNMNIGKFGSTFAKQLIELRALPTRPAGSNAIETALEFTLKWEGGFVNHPNDPGGPTNFGITQRVYDAFRLEKGLATNDVRNITKTEVNAIYFERYWKPCQAELMELHLAVVQFDTAVNFGVGGAIEFLQEALGIEIDGTFGPQTNAAFQANNNQQTANKVVDGRIAYRYQRVNDDPSQQIFLQGWLNRDNDLKNFIRSL